MSAQKSRRSFLSWASGAGLVGAALGAQACATEAARGARGHYAEIPGTNGTPFYLNVTDPMFGGVMNDPTAAATNVDALAACIDEARDRRFAGIGIPAGIFYLSHAANVELANLAIVGGGPLATVIQLLSASNAHVFQVPANASARLVGLTAVGPSTSYSAQLGLLRHAGGSGRVTMTRIHTRLLSSPVRIDGAGDDTDDTHLELHQCDLGGGGTASQAIVAHEGAGSFRCSQTVVRDNSSPNASGLVLAPGVDVDIEDCRFENITDTAISLLEGDPVAGDARIRDCTFDNVRRTAIRTRGGLTEISACEFTLPGGSVLGIELRGGLCRVVRATFAGEAWAVVKAAAGRASAELEVIDCTFTAQCVGASVYRDEDSASLWRISSCNFHDWRTSPIRSLAAQTALHVEDCTFDAGAARPIVILGGSCHIEQCQFTGSEYVFAYAIAGAIHLALVDNDFTRMTSSTGGLRVWPREYPLVSAGRGNRFPPIGPVAVRTNLQGRLRLPEGAVDVALSGDTLYASANHQLHRLTTGGSIRTIRFPSEDGHFLFQGPLILHIAEGAGVVSLVASGNLRPKTTAPMVAGDTARFAFDSISRIWREL